MPLSAMPLLTFHQDETKQGNREMELTGGGRLKILSDGCN